MFSQAASLRGEWKRRYTRATTCAIAAVVARTGSACDGRQPERLSWGDCAAHRPFCDPLHFASLNGNSAASKINALQFLSRDASPKL